MKNRWKQFWKDESGIGVVEIILILVVLIMLVVIFREQITAIVTNAFQQINSVRVRSIQEYRSKRSRA